MKNSRLASIASVQVMALLCLAGTAMAQARPVPDTNTQARNLAESIQVYRQLHSILSHRRCIIAHALHQNEQRDHGNTIENREYAEEIIESNRETTQWLAASNCQTVALRTSHLGPCASGEPTDSSGNGESTE